MRLLLPWRPVWRAGRPSFFGRPSLHAAAPWRTLFKPMPSIVPFFQWCDSTWISLAIRDSRVAFPIIENFHLFALTVLLGSLVVLVLRQFGLVYKTQPISEVAGALRPWN